MVAAKVSERETETRTKQNTEQAAGAACFSLYGVNSENKKPSPGTVEAGLTGYFRPCDRIKHAERVGFGPETTTSSCACNLAWEPEMDTVPQQLVSLTGPLRAYLPVR